MRTGGNRGTNAGRRRDTAPPRPARGSRLGSLVAGLALAIALAACATAPSEDLGANGGTGATAVSGAGPTTGLSSSPTLESPAGSDAASSGPGGQGGPGASPSAAASGSTALDAALAAFDLSPAGRTEAASVVRVVDGDTIVVDRGHGQEKLRYIGMNTPETVAPGQPVQPGGPEASAANKRLVSGQRLWLEKDVSETDRYGRLLRYVWLRDAATRSGWLMVNWALVEEGFAQVATYPPDVRYVELFKAAQADARDAGRGLWAEPAATPAEEAGATARPAGSGCSPSYTPCLPVVDDLDCADVRAMGKAPVHVVGPDVYRLDRDGDRIGCE